MNPLTWVEISEEALRYNLSELRKLVGTKKICACVKANAYGHGAKLIAPMMMEADWFSVNSIDEAIELREIGVQKPILILGYVPPERYDDVRKIDARITVYNKESLKGLENIKTHVKVETGCFRQGVAMENLVDFAKEILAMPNVELEGLSTHFASIEDTTDRAYMDFQLENFKRAIARLEDHQIFAPIKHCANSAATILFPETHFDMVRPGISLYGIWPSLETKLAAEKLGSQISLQPILSWKTKIVQIKQVLKNSFIGYGNTYKTPTDTRLAILPIGYFDGYDRKLSNTGEVLICGKRAPIRGRVCMNMTMVDVTHIPETRLDSEVTLIGEGLPVEDFATWAGTIPYEILSRIGQHVPRMVLHSREKSGIIERSENSQKPHEIYAKKY